MVFLSIFSLHLDKMVLWFSRFDRIYVLHLQLLVCYSLSLVRLGYSILTNLQGLATQQDHWQLAHLKALKLCHKFKLVKRL